MNIETTSQEVNKTLANEEAIEKTVTYTVEEQAVIDKGRNLESFVFADDVFDILECGLDLKRNVFLYGPGGHGKSEGVIAWFNSQGIKPFVVACHSDMSVHDLFGGMNVKEFTETGALTANVHLSFMMHPYVVFEEMGDLPGECLAALKDCLASKEFRNGAQLVELKTKFVVGNSNKTAIEIGKNQSLKAAMERFPAQLEVKWPAYEARHYMDLFKATFGTAGNPVLAQIIEKINSAVKGVNVSPRIANFAFEVFHKRGVEKLKYVTGFDSAAAKNVIANTLEEIKALKTVSDLKEKYSAIEIEYVDFKNSVKVGLSDIGTLQRIKKELGKISSELGVVKLPDDAVILKSEYQNLKKLITALTVDVDAQQLTTSFDTTFENIINAL